MRRIDWNGILQLGFWQTLITLLPPEHPDFLAAHVLEIAAVLACMINREIARQFRGTTHADCRQARLASLVDVIAAVLMLFCHRGTAGVSATSQTARSNKPTTATSSSAMEFINMLRLRRRRTTEAYVSIPGGGFTFVYPSSR
ncbi:MAG: hypothetical protein WBQ94_17125 [Terracidiphilus sp.]